MLTDAFEYIANNYVQATRQSFAQNPVAHFIRKEAASNVRRAIKKDGFLVKGSAGQGTWANTPWISVLYPEVTNKTSDGYYVVYLFSADMSHIYLSLNQAVTPFQEKHGKDAIRELRKRANEISNELTGLKDTISNAPIDLKSNGKLARLYEAGHVCGHRYTAKNLPSERQLQEDLNAIVKLYTDYADHNQQTFQSAVTMEPVADNSLQSIKEDAEEYTIEPLGTIPNNYERGPSDPNHSINKARRQWQKNRVQIIEFVRSSKEELEFILEHLGPTGDNGGPPLDDDPLSQILPQLRDLKHDLTVLIKDLEAPFPFHQKARSRINDTLDKFEANLTQREAKILKATGKALLPGAVKWVISSVREHLKD